MDRLKEIARELEDIRDREALRLWRLARKAAAHGCSVGLVDRIRGEGWDVQRMYPEHLLSVDLNYRFTFAFKERVEF